MSTILVVIALLLAAVVVYDLVQRKHAILRNFPIVGHLRYLLEAVGPELRQYIVTNDDEERPFTRDQRRWIYASSKRQNNYFGFGTDNDLEHPESYLIVKHAAFPLPDPPPPASGPRHPLPCAKVLGAARGRARAFRPASVVNLSAMSFGSLSRPAVEAMNRGAKLAGCLQCTGEGGIAPPHLSGGELVWQIGTGYFGCRDARGRFDMERFLERCASAPVRAIELKLSQGAKPGHGGILPAAKVTPEIAAIRGVAVGEDCISPPGHTAFSDADSLLDFVERLAEATGLPVGIKSAVGQMEFWDELAELMERTGRGVDFVTIDGGEGGTGAAPLVYADHVALPFKVGFARVYRRFAARGLTERLVFVGSGRLGLPQESLFAFALGCDLVNVAREAMLAVGCIQAKRCHTGHCPTGVATQNRWLTRGLDPDSKSQRLASYVDELRGELAALARACGVPHPALVTSEELELVDPRYGARTVREVFDYDPAWGRPSPEDVEALLRAMKVSEPSTRVPVTA